MEKDYKLIKVLNAAAFLTMITVNALANILPINSITTGEVSDSYPNLFAPAGITFAIWGAIYLLLAMFVLYSFGIFKGKSGYSDRLIAKIKYCFAISSIANILWIFAWHYNKIGISVLLMLAIFVSLMFAYRRINKESLTTKERIFVGVPFSVYFGWISVALIANITVYLVSTNWDGFGIESNMWTVMVIVVGVIIAVVNVLRFKDIAYGLTIIWAYIGILIKHLSVSGFAGSYIGIIIVLECSLFLLLVAIGAIAAMNAKQKKTEKK